MKATNANHYTISDRCRNREYVLYMICSKLVILFYYVLDLVPYRGPMNPETRDHKPSYGLSLIFLAVEKPLSSNEMMSLLTNYHVSDA